MHRFPTQESCVCDDRSTGPEKRTTGRDPLTFLCPCWEVGTRLDNCLISLLSLPSTAPVLLHIKSVPSHFLLTIAPLEARHQRDDTAGSHYSSNVEQRAVESTEQSTDYITSSVLPPLHITFTQSSLGLPSGLYNIF